jgi:hypothetical protein
MLIRDLAGLAAPERKARLNALGDRAAAHLRVALARAAAGHSRVYCVTHVPPFREACVDEVGRVSEPRLPFYTCKAVGDVILEAAGQHPGCQFTVLCGHTHDECDVRIRDNVRVVVKGAAYASWYTPHVLTLAPGGDQLEEARVD